MATTIIQQGLMFKPLLKKTLKDNWKLWAVITAAITGMITLIISVPSLTDNSKLGAMMDSGVSFAGQGLTMLYPMFIVMLASVYAVVTANKLIAAQVDRGSMGYIMVNPIKRNQFSVTQGIFMAGSVAGIFAVVTAVGSVALALTGDAATIGFFAFLNLGCMLLILACSGVAFLASCIFNRSGASLAMGGGIVITSFLLSFLSQLEEYVSFFKVFHYTTLHALFNTTHIVEQGASMILDFSILAVIAIVCYIAGAVIFKKKDLPL